jgi:hypothetical protein
VIAVTLEIKRQGQVALASAWKKRSKHVRKKWLGPANPYFRHKRFNSWRSWSVLLQWLDRLAAVRR